jgi:cell wall-associated NlpC family hydrolase
VNLKPYIVRSARRHGVDPRAAIAVARQEGGLNAGAVGDSGTSYGPFQLHVGGALPRGRGASWANSPAGIDYALGAMARSGAKGLTGPQAVRTIVSRFERPANPQREISRAMSSYGVSEPLSATMGVPRGPAVAGRKPDAFIRGVLRYQRSGGKDVQSLINSLAAARRQATPYGVTDPKGTLHPPDFHTNPNIQRVLYSAHTQIGKPYQFGSGPSTASFDCSDLIQWAYKNVGVNLPRTTYGQIHVGRAVHGGLQPGDLIFPSTHHVVMYVGGGRVIAAPHTGTVVQYQPLSRFGKPVAVRRVL